MPLFDIFDYFNLFKEYVNENKKKASNIAASSINYVHIKSYLFRFFKCGKQNSYLGRNAKRADDKEIEARF